MALPSAVAKATEDLAALEQQLMQPAPVVPEVVDEQTATLDLPTDKDTEHQDDSVSPDVPPVVPEEKWEHKYRRLQGKYDAEVPRLHKQVKELQSALSQMQLQLQQPPPPPVAPPPPPPPAEKPAEPERYVSDEDVANYGEDFVDIQRRIALDATREMRKQIDELKAQLVAQNDQVQNVQSFSFDTRLRLRIPDFDQVNADPSWVEWLNEVDPLIRGPRRMVAQEAYVRQDIEAVKSYVDLWRQSQTPVTPAAPKASRDQELQRQVQPNRATAPTTPSAHNGKKVYNLTEANRVFADIQKLTSQGRFDDAQRLEAEISTAYAEGRIIG